MAWGGPALTAVAPVLAAARPLPPLVPVLPDWQVQGFFGDRIYALRPWSAQVPKAIGCFVDHLRHSFANGFPAASAR